MGMMDEKLGLDVKLAIDVSGAEAPIKEQVMRTKLQMQELQKEFTKVKEEAGAAIKAVKASAKEAISAETSVVASLGTEGRRAKNAATRAKSQSRADRDSALREIYDDGIDANGEVVSQGLRSAETEYQRRYAELQGMSYKDPQHDIKKKELSQFKINELIPRQEAVKDVKDEHLRNSLNIDKELIQAETDILTRLKAQDTVLQNLIRERKELLRTTEQEASIKIGGAKQKLDLGKGELQEARNQLEAFKKSAKGIDGIKLTESQAALKDLIEAMGRTRTTALRAQQSLGAFAAGGASQVQAFIQASDNLLRFHTTLTAVTGSSELATAKLKEFDDLAAKSKFDVTSIREAGVTMTQMRIDTEKYLPIANAMATAMGKTIPEAVHTLSGALLGNPESLEQLRYSYGITAARLIEFGAAHDNLGRVLTKGVGNVQRYSEALTRALEPMSRTMEGSAQQIGVKMTNLSDLIVKNFEKIGSAVSPTIGFILDVMTEMVQAFQGMTGPLGVVYGAFVTLATGLTVAGHGIAHMIYISTTFVQSLARTSLALDTMSQQQVLAAAATRTATIAQAQQALVTETQALALLKLERGRLAMIDLDAEAAAVASGFAAAESAAADAAAANVIAIDREILAKEELIAINSKLVVTEEAAGAAALQSGAANVAGGAAVLGAAGNMKKAGDVAKVAAPSLLSFRGAWGAVSSGAMKAAEAVSAFVLSGVGLSVIAIGIGALAYTWIRHMEKMSAATDKETKKSADNLTRLHATFSKIRSDVEGHPLDFTPKNIPTEVTSEDLHSAGDILHGIAQQQVNDTEALKLKIHELKAANKELEVQRVLQAKVGNKQLAEEYAKQIKANMDLILSEEDKRIALHKSAEQHISDEKELRKAAESREVLSHSASGRLKIVDMDYNDLQNRINAGTETEIQKKHVLLSIVERIQREEESLQAQKEKWETAKEANKDLPESPEYKEAMANLDLVQKQYDQIIKIKGEAQQAVASAKSEYMGIRLQQIETERSEGEISTKEQIRRITALRDYYHQYGHDVTKLNAQLKDLNYKRYQDQLAQIQAIGQAQLQADESAAAALRTRVTKQGYDPRAANMELQDIRKNTEAWEDKALAQERAAKIRATGPDDAKALHLVQVEYDLKGQELKAKQKARNLADADTFHEDLARRLQEEGQLLAASKSVVEADLEGLRQRQSRGQEVSAQILERVNLLYQEEEALRRNAVAASLEAVHADPRRQAQIKKEAADQLLASQKKHEQAVSSEVEKSFQIQAQRATELTSIRKLEFEEKARLLELEKVGGGTQSTKSREIALAREKGEIAKQEVLDREKADSILKSGVELQLIQKKAQTEILQINRDTRQSVLAIKSAYDPSISSLDQMIKKATDYKAIIDDITNREKEGTASSDDYDKKMDAKFHLRVEQDKIKKEANRQRFADGPTGDPMGDARARMKARGFSDDKIEENLRTRGGSIVDRLRQGSGKREGLTDEQIRANLLKKGMKKEDIDAAFTASKNPAASSAGDVSGASKQEMDRRIKDDEAKRKKGEARDRSIKLGLERRARDEKDSAGSSNIREERDEDGNVLLTNRKDPRAKKKGGPLDPKDFQADPLNKSKAIVEDPAAHAMLERVETALITGFKDTVQALRDKLWDAGSSVKDLGKRVSNSVKPSSKSPTADHDAAANSTSSTTGDFRYNGIPRYSNEGQ